MKVSPSKNTGPAGTTDGTGGEGVHELHPGLGDHLPGGGQGGGAAHGGVLVVRQYEDDVGSPGAGADTTHTETGSQHHHHHHRLHHLGSPARPHGVRLSGARSLLEAPASLSSSYRLSVWLSDRQPVTVSQCHRPLTVGDVVTQSTTVTTNNWEIKCYFKPCELWYKNLQKYLLVPLFDIIRKSL